MKILLFSKFTCMCPWPSFLFIPSSLLLLLFSSMSSCTSWKTNSYYSFLATYSPNLDFVTQWSLIFFFPFLFALFVLYTGYSLFPTTVQLSAFPKILNISTLVSLFFGEVSHLHNFNYLLLWTIHIAWLDFSRNYPFFKSFHKLMFIQVS